MGLVDKIGDDVIAGGLGADRGYCLEHVFLERSATMGLLTG
jgi:hypothetical protein